MAAMHAWIRLVLKAFPYPVLSSSSPVLGCSCSLYCHLLAVVIDLTHRLHGVGKCPGVKGSPGRDTEGGAAALQAEMQKLIGLQYIIDACSIFLCVPKRVNSDIFLQMPSDVLCLVCMDVGQDGRCRYCICRGPWYCSRICQRNDWPRHRHECPAAAVRHLLRKAGYPKLAAYKTMRFLY